MEIKLSGKRALVTGANSGIGEAIALALGQAGAKVVVNYLANPADANAVVQRIKAAGSDALAIEGDISKADTVAAMFTQMDQAWGGVDILVNNAGVDGSRAEGWAADPAAWKRVIEINLFGAFNCSREALKRMVAQKGGVVLNISSVHEIIAWSGYSAYTASKAAIGMMAKTFAQEAAPYNVRVLSLAPGAIKTAINRSVWSDPRGLR
ncbi:MAG: SDR family NAD(P)-dependent oxidoreductase, partial [Verrucomicrobia bacterium]|nr:SDR family NAD(P)-dependent oxidoreductase [Verrucomicrobiota bacterium]